MSAVDPLGALATRCFCVCDYGLAERAGWWVVALVLAAWAATVYVAYLIGDSIGYGRGRAHRRHL